MTLLNPKTGAEILPDTSNWTDKGCEVFPTCLSCPLPQCIEEKPRGKQKLRMQVRSSRIVRLRKKGKTTAEIAGLLQVNQRTVQRAIKASRGVRKPVILSEVAVAEHSRSEESPLFPLLEAFTERSRSGED